MSTSPSSPPKRPRLSLQINAIANGRTGRTSRCLAAAVDVKSPTAFNTLSNVYATAVDRSTPVRENPPTAILNGRPVLRLQTQDVAVKDRPIHPPYLGPYLDTPITAQPMSPAISKEICFPSAVMTATPPLSAQPSDQKGNHVFTFDTMATASSTAATATAHNVKAPETATQNPKRRTSMPSGTVKLPYIHPRTLRSILRNSPLPPLSTKSPESPRRQSLRLQEKAARRVAYNSPLTQTITTSKYVKSHIDLLAEDSTPVSPLTSSSDDGDNALDEAMAHVNQTRDGGQTPGPFEEMRRRMANMHASTPVASTPGGGGIRKRSSKRLEKKRRWVWTIGQDEDGEEGGNPPPVATADANTKAQPPPPAAPPLAVSVPVLAVPTPRQRRTRSQTQAAAARLAAAAMAAAQEEQAKAQTQIPLLAAPVPPARASNDATASSPPALTQAQAQGQQTETREPTPIPPSLLPDVSSTREPTPIPPILLPDESSNTTRAYLGSREGTITPEPTLPTGMGVGATEPPTPSVESVTSQASSVFERNSSSNSSGGVDGDVEMSDVSSLLSSDDGGEHQWSFSNPEQNGRENHTHIGCADSGSGGGVDDDVDMDDGTPTMTARPVLSSGKPGGRGWAPWADVDVPMPVPMPVPVDGHGPETGSIP